jgi:catechol 2,3-dioxygenase-like lactoylglutathione lyase family enzyme
MGVQLTKNAVDLGIVTTDGDRAVAFYEGVLGFEREWTVPLPGGGTMYRMLCGDTIFKIMAPTTPPDPALTTPERDEFEPAQSVTGLVQRTCALTGIRFITIWVSNLAELAEACKQFGAPFVYEVEQSRPGVVIAVVEDPDGNWIEFVDYTDPDAARADMAMKHGRLAEGDTEFVQT